MKYDINSYSDVEVEGTTIENDITLSSDSQSLIFQMFSKNIYSNPIGSIIREITCNCFDSHAEASMNDMPILIRKSIDVSTNNIYISFIDYGVGMSPERINDVFSIMFSSTKRNDNQQIGCFGLGSKVPLAYKRSTGLGEGEYDNSYSIITNFNHIKYTYLIYEGKNCPKITLLTQEPTEEGNGTEVRIQVLEKDLSRFQSEMIRQLYYFENVVFEGFTDEKLTNSYQILRAKSFLYRGNGYSSNVHVCLGRVAYPLNYENLGLSASDYSFPVAIRLEVGDINVTVSRENLDYSEKTIKMLKAKLLEVKAELTEMLSKQYENIVTLEDYFRVKNDFGWLFFPNGDKINLGEKVNMKDVDFTNFKYNFLKMPNDKQLYKFFFETKLYGKKESTSRRRRWYNGDDDNVFTGSYDNLTVNKAKRVFYYYDGSFERKIIKQAYLKSMHVRYFLINKKNLLDKAYSFTAISDLFNVVDPIFEADGITPTKYMESILDMQEEYMEIVRRQCTDYNALEVPEYFIEDRKRNRLTQEMRNTTINIKFASRGGRYRVKLNTLFNVNFAIYYGNTDEESEVRNASNSYDMLFGSDSNIIHYYEHNNRFRTETKKGIMFIVLSKNNLKYMEFCRNAHPVSEFKSRMLKRKEKDVMEFFQAQKFINRYYQISDIYTSPAFSKVSTEWANKIAKVRKFVTSIRVESKLNWERYENTLKYLYNLDSIVLTKEQENYVSTIEDVLFMQELNADTLKYINFPYYLDDAKDTFWNLMKKVLVY